MKVTITYDNGRIDVFDDARFTTQQPFGKTTMLVNYELRVDRLGKTGLWLTMHHYDTTQETQSKDPVDITPVATRKRGWRFLLAERAELEHVVQIKADDKEIAFRVGDDLMDAVRFKQMVDLCVNEASEKSKARCAAELFQTLTAIDGAKHPREIASSFGFSMRALDRMHAVNGAAPRKEDEKKDGGNGAATAAASASKYEKRSPDWMKELDDEDSD